MIRDLQYGIRRSRPTLPVGRFAGVPICAIPHDELRMWFRRPDLRQQLDIEQINAICKRLYRKPASEVLALPGESIGAAYDRLWSGANPWPEDFDRSPPDATRPGAGSIGRSIGRSS